MYRSISVAFTIAIVAGSVGCGGFALFGGRQASDDEGSAAVAAWRASLEHVGGDEHTAAALEELSAEIEVAEGGRREELRAVRGEALFDLAVYAWAVEVHDPFGADAAFDILADVTGVSPLSDRFELSVALAIEEDLRLGGVEAARAERARALLAPPDDLAQPEALFLRWAESDPWIAPRARLMALRAAASRFGTWSRRGTGGGGDALVRECGFLCGLDDAPVDVSSIAVQAGYACHRDTPSDPDDAWIGALYEARPDWQPYDLLWRCGREGWGLPILDDALPLLSAPNYLDAVALRAFNDLVDAAVADLESGARASVASADFVRDVATRVRSAAVPLSITANLITGDATLQVPRAFEQQTPTNGDRLAQEPRLRTLVVRSDGVWLVLRPHLRYRPAEPGTPGHIEFAERALELHWPGQRVLTFDGAGAVAVDDVESGEVPLLATAMGETEARLAEQVWVPVEEHPTRLAEGGTVPVSLIVDGDTYLTTIEPIVATLLDAGYGPLVFHTWHPGLGRLSAAPMLVAPSSDTAVHRVEVRSDGYVVHPWGGQEALPPVLISRAGEAPLVQLYQTFFDGIADGRFDPSVPIAVVPADPTADYGSLVHLVTALAWERIAPAEDDLGLLNTSVALDDGTPRRLNRGGIVLSW